MSKILVITFPGLPKDQQDFEILGTEGQIKELTKSLLIAAHGEKYPPFCRLETKDVSTVVFSQIE